MIVKFDSAEQFNNYMRDLKATLRIKHPEEVLLRKCVNVFRSLLNKRLGNINLSYFCSYGFYALMKKMQFMSMRTLDALVSCKINPIVFHIEIPDVFSTCLAKRPDRTSIPSIKGTDF